MLAPTAAAIWRTSSGSKDAPQASGVGKMVAVQAAKPVRHSSCATNAEPARRDDLRLQLAQRAGGLGGRQRPGAEHPGELAQAVPDELGKRGLWGVEVALHRGHVGVPRLAAQPDAGQLRDLLLQCHPAEQVRDPFRGRPGRIPPELRVLVDHRAAHRAGPMVPVDSGVNSTASPFPRHDRNSFGNGIAT
jgi:hypothetical protein